MIGRRLDTDFALVLSTGPLNMAETPLQYHRPLPPIGILQLAAVVEDATTGGAWSEHVDRVLRQARRKRYQASARVVVIDNMRTSFHGDYSDTEFLEQIEAVATSVASDRLFIGFYVLSDMMPSVRRILCRVRYRFPFARILAGGPHATFFPQDFYLDAKRRRGPLVDFVVRNEGERAILGILSGDFDDEAALRRNGPAYGIDPSRCNYEDPDLRVIDGGQFGSDNLDGGFGRHVLDALPAPAYFLLEDADGRLPYEPDRRYRLQAPAANLNSSRGCPHKCTFCTIPKLAPGYRTHSPKRMLDLAHLLHLQHDVSSIFFREDNFIYGGGTIEGDRWEDVREFADRSRSKLPNMRYAIEARADNLVMDADDGSARRRIDVLAEAGFRGIYVGVESGSPQMLKLYGKGESVETLSAALHACREKGVAVVATACYSDPDLLLRSRYPLIEQQESSYIREIVHERERILEATRSFFQRHRIPPERCEEYVLVGIPISTTYSILERERMDYPQLVEYFDPVTRYLYPKGFQWWAARVYGSQSRVRSYYGYSFDPGR